MLKLVSDDDRWLEGCRRHTVDEVLHMRWCL